MSDISHRIVGSSWNHPGPRPVIEGNVLKSPHEITGFEAGGQRVMRTTSTEPTYMSDVFSSSLVSRAIGALGVTQAWTALYD
jgi:hypothetical protein